MHHRMKVLLRVKLIGSFFLFGLGVAAVNALDYESIESTFVNIPVSCAVFDLVRITSKWAKDIWGEEKKNC